MTFTNLLQEIRDVMKDPGAGLTAAPIAHNDIIVRAFNRIQLHLYRSFPASLLDKLQMQANYTQTDQTLQTWQDSDVGVFALPADTNVELIRPVVGYWAQTDSLRSEGYSNQQADYVPADLFKTYLQFNRPTKNFPIFTIGRWSTSKNYSLSETSLLVAPALDDDDEFLLVYLKGPLEIATDESNWNDEIGWPDEFYEAFAKILAGSIEGGLMSIDPEAAQVLKQEGYDWIKAYAQARGIDWEVKF